MVHCRFDDDDFGDGLFDDDDSSDGLMGQL